jgi:hypothetical protein
MFQKEDEKLSSTIPSIWERLTENQLFKVQVSNPGEFAQYSMQSH